ncbi:MAG: hypothetical protein IPN02_10180 [Candidatus Microthrix sp.]|uniref:Uncharacterized protein n=1 Tax=Candidatus Neomicrothrix subdominans TaxID=2954438 RepID=A0A936TEX9_9ACTN|nr:hypothetical protein [Candidatus Microthrix subdominans]
MELDQPGGPGGERVDLLVEAAANPFVNPNVVTDLSDLATGPDLAPSTGWPVPRWPPNTEVGQLVLEIDFLLRLGWTGRRRRLAEAADAPLLGAGGRCPRPGRHPRVGGGCTGRTG